MVRPISGSIKNHEIFSSNIMKNLNFRLRFFLGHPVEEKDIRLLSVIGWRCSWALYGIQPDFWHGNNLLVDCQTCY